MSDIDELDSYLIDDEPELPSLQELDQSKNVEQGETNTDKLNKDNQTVDKLQGKELYENDLHTDANSHHTNTASQQEETGKSKEDALLNSLEQEFSKVFIKNQTQKDDASGNTAANEFQELLKMISEASKSDPQGLATPLNKNKTGGPTTSTDFKDIMNNTLGRLKENSTKIDTDLKNQQQQQQQQNINNTKGSQVKDDILAQLLDQLVAGDNDGEGDNGDDGSMMDNAILKMLDQMCTKDVLYQPMKEMQLNFQEWLKKNGADEFSTEDWDRYMKQNQCINKIVKIYELPDYTNDRYVSQVTDLLDELESLGDTPEEVASTGTFSGNGSGINNNNNNNSNNNNDDMQLDEKALENLDQELQENCQQQ
ncbi:hypothetical protein ACO0QE_001897 [Hanseniaspora vineae]